MQIIINFIFNILFNIILNLFNFFCNIFKTVIGIRYWDSQPCWAKPNSLVELFNNPKMWIFTNNINLLKFNFDIYTPKPFDELAPVSIDSIFIKPFGIPTILLSEIQNIESLDEEADKLTNAIKFIEIQIINENFNLSFSSNNINNKPPFLNFISIILEKFIYNYNNDYEILKINSNFLNIKNNNLIQHQFILLNNTPKFLFNKFINVDFIFLVFLLKNEFFIPKLPTINIYKPKNLSKFFQFFSLNKYYFFFNFENIYIQIEKLFFPWNNIILFFNESFLNIYYFNCNLFNYKTNKIPLLKFKFPEKIIQINLFKINNNYLIKFLKKKNIFIFFFRYKKTYTSYYNIKFQKYLFFSLERNKNIFINKKNFKNSITKINWLLSSYYKYPFIFKKLLKKDIYIKYFSLLKENNIIYDHERLRHEMIKRKKTLPKKLLYLSDKHNAIIIDFTFFFKQFFLIQFYKHADFNFFHIKENLKKKIKIFSKSLNLFKKIKYNYNHKIIPFKINEFYKKIKNNFLKKFIYIFSIFFFLLLTFLSIMTYFLIYFYKNILSRNLKKKLKKRYYKICFFYFWYYKTRSYKLKKFITNILKIFYIFFIKNCKYIYNIFLKKFYFFFYSIIFFIFIFKKLIKFIFIKIIFIIFFLKFFFFAYLKILKNNYFWDEKFLLNFFFKLKKLKKIKKNNFYYFLSYHIKEFLKKIFLSIKKKKIITFFNFISKINIKIIIFFQKENTFFWYLYKNINNKNLFSRYLNLYLILCFRNILIQKPYYYIDYFFFKNNDFFELIFFDIYFSLVFCKNLRICSIHFLYEFIPNIFFLKRFLIKPKKFKLFNIIHILNNKIFFKKKKIIFYFILFLKMLLLFLYWLFKNKCIKYFLEEWKKKK